MVSITMAHAATIRISIATLSEKGVIMAMSRRNRRMRFRGASSDRTIARRAAGWRSAETDLRSEHACVVGATSDDAEQRIRRWLLRGRFDRQR